MNLLCRILGHQYERTEFAIVTPTSRERSGTCYRCGHNPQTAAEDKAYAEHRARLAETRGRRPTITRRHIYDSGLVTTEKYHPDGTIEYE